MHDHDPDGWFQSFDCHSIPLAENTVAAPRPSDRSRYSSGSPEAASSEVLVSFDCAAEMLPPNTPAAPRPSSRPRETQFNLDPTDTAFAKELTERMLDYVRSRPEGVSAEQLALLVQQLLAKRPA